MVWNIVDLVQKGSLLRLEPVEITVLENSVGIGFRALRVTTDSVTQEIFRTSSKFSSMEVVNGLIYKLPKGGGRIL